MAKTTMRQAINNRIARYKVEQNYHKKEFLKADKEVKEDIKRKNEMSPFYNPVFILGYINKMSEAFIKIREYGEKILEDERLLTYLDYNG